MSGNAKTVGPSLRDQLAGLVVGSLRVPAAASACRRRRMIRVLVVDDHPAVRTAVVNMLDSTSGVTAVGAAPDGRQGVELAGRTKPDIILMDVSMPIMSGIEATRRIIQEQPEARVLIFSGELRHDVIKAAREAGAVGFVAKGCRATDVLRAIRAVMSGRSAWPDAAFL